MLPPTATDVACHCLSQLRPGVAVQEQRQRLQPAGVGEGGFIHLGWAHKGGVGHVALWGVPWPWAHKAGVT